MAMMTYEEYGALFGKKKKSYDENYYGECDENVKINRKEWYEVALKCFARIMLEVIDEHLRPNNIDVSINDIVQSIMIHRTCTEEEKYKGYNHCLSDKMSYDDFYTIANMAWEFDFTPKHYILSLKKNRDKNLQLRGSRADILLDVVVYMNRLFRGPVYNRMFNKLAVSIAKYREDKGSVEMVKFAGKEN